METTANPQYLYGVTALLKLFAEAAKHHEDQAANHDLGEYGRPLSDSLTAEAKADEAVAANALGLGFAYIICTHPLPQTLRHPTNGITPHSLSAQNNAGQLRFLREVPSASAPI